MAVNALPCAVGSSVEVRHAFMALLSCLLNPLREQEYLGKKKKKKNHKAGVTLDDSLSFVSTTKRLALLLRAHREQRDEKLA